MRYADRFVDPWLVNNLNTPVLLRLGADGGLTARRADRPDGGDAWTFRADEGDGPLLERLRAEGEVRGLVRLETVRRPGGSPWDVSREIRFVDDAALEEERRRDRQRLLEERIGEHLRKAAGRATARTRWRAVDDLAARAGLRHRLATKVVLSGLLRHSNGSGDNAATVAHVVVGEDLVRGRLRRPAGSPLCGPGEGSFGLDDLPRNSGHPLCRGCCAVLERLAGAALAEAQDAARAQERGAAGRMAEGRATFAVAVLRRGCPTPEVAAFVADDAEQAERVAGRLAAADGVADVSRPVPVPVGTVGVLGPELADADELLAGPPAPGP